MSPPPGRPDRGRGGAVAQVQHDLLELAHGCGPARRAPDGTRTGARCRGSRTGGSGAPRPPSDRSRRSPPRPADRRKNAVSNTATCGMPGKAAMRLLDAVRIRRVVQRRQQRQVPDLLQHSVIDDHRVAEHRAAVHHPVADGDQRGLVQRLPASANSCRITVSAAPWSGIGPAQLNSARRRPCGWPTPSPPIRSISPVAARVAGGRRVDQLVLHRGGPGVDHQHVCRSRLRLRSSRSAPALATVDAFPCTAGTAPCA